MAQPTYSADNPFAGRATSGGMRSYFTRRAEDWERRNKKKSLPHPISTPRKASKGELRRVDAPKPKRLTRPDASAAEPPKYPPVVKRDTPTPPSSTKPAEAAKPYKRPDASAAEPPKYPPVVRKPEPFKPTVPKKEPPPRPYTRPDASATEPPKYPPVVTRKTPEPPSSTKPAEAAKPDTKPTPAVGAPKPERPATEAGHKPPSPLTKPTKTKPVKPAGHPKPLAETKYKELTHAEMTRVGKEIKPHAARVEARPEKGTKYGSMSAYLKAHGNGNGSAASNGESGVAWKDRAHRKDTMVWDKGLGRFVDRGVSGLKRERMK